MSFALPQEATRLSYAPPAPSHSIYISPPAPHPVQPPAPSPYYQNPREPPHPQDKPSRARVQLAKPSPRENQPQSTQLQDPSYLFQLQQAAPPLPSTLEAHNAFQPVPQPLPSQNVPQDLSNGEHTQARSDRSNSQIITNGATSESPNPANSDQADNLTAQIAKMTPPPEAVYPTFEALLSAANAWGLERGYAMVIGRSKKKNRIGLKKVLLTCDKGGTSKHTMLPHDSPLRKRVTTSRKTGCPFGVYAIETTTEWTLKYRPDPGCCVHNHGPSKGAVDHPAARKLDANAVAAVRALKDAGVSAQETLKQIQAAQPGAKLLARDVYNARAALRREATMNNAPANPSDPSPSSTYISARSDNSPNTVLNTNPSPNTTNNTTTPTPPTTHPNPNLVPTIYKRAAMTPEERFREECRLEVAKAKEEVDRVRSEHRAEVEELRRQLAEKDKMIEKFEMFIDICNGRVMMQRERLAGEMGGAGAGAAGNGGVSAVAAGVTIGGGAAKTGPGVGVGVGPGGTTGSSRV